jgi:hypothetical protein
VSSSPNWRITAGGLIDAAIVLSLLGFWLECGPHDKGRDIFDVAAPLSVSGVYLVARRLLTSDSPPPAGIGLWGVHGFVGLVSLGVFLTMQKSAGTAEAWSIPQGVLTCCAAALIVQVLIGLVAFNRLIQRRTRGFGDVLGTSVCAAYAFVMSGWVLQVFR